MATVAGECGECGDDVLLETTASQEGGGWWAYDGDDGQCVSCGVRHVVHVDDSDEDNVTAWLVVVEDLDGIPAKGASDD